MSKQAGSKFHTHHEATPQGFVDSPQSGFFRGPASNRDMSIATMYFYPKLSLGDYEGDGQLDLFAVQ